MLGKTAGGLYWMFRYLERSENTARLIEAGFRIALTSSKDSTSEWKSIVTTAGVTDKYNSKHKTFNDTDVVDFLLRDLDNPSSVLSAVESARTNARMVRTALTTEVWEAVNENWMEVKTVLRNSIQVTDLPAVLGVIRKQSALVRGAMQGTMLRNDIYDFTQLGTALERADNTARIIDVKYYTLLPSASYVGSSLDNVQWETILRSVSAHRAFRWLNEGDMTPATIANFLILDKRFPRSLIFNSGTIVDNLGFLEKDYGERHPCHGLAESMKAELKRHSIASIFDMGLHEFIRNFIQEINALSRQIESDFRFSA